MLYTVSALSHARGICNAFSYTDSISGTALQPLGFLGDTCKPVSPLSGEDVHRQLCENNCTRVPKADFSQQTLGLTSHYCGTTTDVLKGRECQIYLKHGAGKDYLKCSIGEGYGEHFHHYACLSNNFSPAIFLFLRGQRTSTGKDFEHTSTFQSTHTELEFFPSTLPTLHFIQY